MNYMTAQEIFDTVVAHARKQNATAGTLDSNGDIETCLYRTSDGKKCFVGALIPDSLYVPAMENKPVPKLQADGLLPLDLIPHVQLLSDLQKVHDTYDVVDWETQLAKVARKHHLNYTTEETGNA